MRLPVVENVWTKIDEEHATKMIHLAVDNGVNYFDNAYAYHAADFSTGGSSEPLLAKALKNGYRDKVHIATKLPSWLIQSRQDMDKYLEEQLERMNEEYFDFYLLHWMHKDSWPNLVKHGVTDFLDKAIKDGKIRYAGFSFHDKLPLFKEIIDAYDWTLCQIQYNYYDEDFPPGREGLAYAAQKDIAVAVMEPLRGGSLADRIPSEVKAFFENTVPNRSAVDWALRWVWSQPEASVVLSGMSHLDHVRENLALAENVSEAAWTDSDSEVIAKAMEIINNLQKVDCTSCSYCMPCPEGVNIPRNFELYNDHFLFNDPNAKQWYGFFGKAEKASNCIQCGQCEEHCPQQIPIPAELEKVVELFEK
jgi:predicted aldo/keto reductase-like oxidoreductase